MAFVLAVLAQLHRGSKPGRHLWVAQMLVFTEGLHVVPFSFAIWLTPELCAEFNGSCLNFSSVSCFALCFLLSPLSFCPAPPVCPPYPEQDSPSASRGLQCPDGSHGIGEEALKAYWARIRPSTHRSHADPTSLGGQERRKKKMHQLSNSWMTCLSNWMKWDKMSTWIPLNPRFLHRTRGRAREAHFSSLVVNGLQNPFLCVSEVQLPSKR